MTQENGPKPTTLRLAAVSIILATFGTLLLVGGRLFEFGWEKVLGDIWVYVGLFFFIVVVTMGALLLARRLEKRKE